MNSNGRGHSQLLIAVVMVSLAVSQFFGHHRIRTLERELAQLRLAQSTTTVREAKEAQEAPRVAQAVVPQARAVSRQAVASVLDLDPLQITPISLDYAEESEVRVARAAHRGRGLRELSEGELDQVVAGVLAPAPGLLVAAGGPAATLPGGTAVEQTETIPSQTLTPRVERGGVLLRRGRTQVEPTFSYSHLSKNRVGLSGFSVFDVIFIGEISAEEIDRDLFTTSLNIRHGVTDNLQVDVEVPAQYQREETLSGPVDARVESASHDFGLNDIRTGFFYQFARERLWLPGLIAHLQAKIPTGDPPRLGSGVWGVKSGLLMVKSSDPVVLFSNLAYTVNFPGDVNGVDTDPGDSVELSAGIAYALNYNVALNAGFEQIFIGALERRGANVVGSRLVVSNLKTGLTIALTKKVSMDVSVSAGLTEDAPDLIVSVSFPFTF